MPSWSDIWTARQVAPATRDKVAPASGSLLAQLLTADGYDSGLASMPEAAWRDYVLACAARVGIAAGDGTLAWPTPERTGGADHAARAVTAGRRQREAAGRSPGKNRLCLFEVGCGAGAFLLPLAERGCRVGGLDYSPALIAAARAAMPQGDWRCGEATMLLPAADFLVASGVFLYFPSHEYAARVLAAMAAAARRGLMILDIPDAARRAATEATRRSTLGEEEYARRYAGLDHLYFDRGWFAPRLPGFQVETCDQSIPGYANSPGRFNLFATPA